MYLLVTMAAVVVVLTLVYLVARAVVPGFTLLGLRRREGDLLLWIVGGIAFGTVVGTTWLLKRFFGKEFGTYLDDPDADVEGLHPACEKVCLRCGTPFAAFRNEFHAAGFCSHLCWKAAARK